MKGSSKNILFMLVILLLDLCLSSVIVLNDAYASTENSDQSRSPSFPNQEIIDPTLDWIYYNNTHTTSGDRSTDIVAVDYYSDGKELYAILWLYHPFQPEQSSYEEVNYGMYIDADFDPTTGFGGIEYKVEISWDNQTKNWTRVLEKWSHFGQPIVLDNQTIAYTDFSKIDANYVTLSVDLKDLLSPKKYKVIFYGEVMERREGFLIADFTRMIAIPPLELSVSTSPNSIELRKGESKTIEVKVNTTQGYEPTVNINVKSQTGDLVLGFAQKQSANEVWNLSSKRPVQVLQGITQNDTSLKPDTKLRIPSYGVATIPLTITSRESSLVGPYTMFIFVNSSFPPEEFLKPRPIKEKERASTFLPQSVLTPENIFTQSSLLVTLSDRLPWIDYVGDLWNKLGGPLSFTVGLFAGHIGPWIFRKMKDWSKGRRLGTQKKL